MRHIFGKPIILQDYKNINFKLVHIFWNKIPYLGNFFLAKNITKARTTCKLEEIDIYMVIIYIVVIYMVVTYIVVIFNMKSNMFVIGHVNLLLLKSLHIQGANTHE
jgi:hypothetical protein